MPKESEKKRERRLAAELGLTIIEYRQRYAPHRLGGAPRLNEPRLIKKDPDRKIRLKVYARDGYLCRYCGIAVIRDVGPIHVPNEATIDHIIPRGRGGRNLQDNLVTCCYRCNHKKKDLTAQEAGYTVLEIGTAK